MADPIELGPDVLALSSGLAVAAAGFILATSLAVFIFERTSSELSRSWRVLARISSVVLLVVGASLLEQALFVRSLGVSPFVASIFGAAFVVLVLLVASRFVTGAVLRRLPKPSGAGASSGEPSPRPVAEDWRWVVQLIDLTDMTELQHFVVERLADLLHARGGAILLADSGGSAFEVTYSTIERNLLKSRTRLPAEAPLAAHVAKRRRPILRARLELEDRRTLAGVLNDLDALHAELVIPLISRGRLLGIVAFGRCVESDGYAEAAIERAMLEADVIAAVTDSMRVYNLALQEKFRTGVLLEQIMIGVLAADHSGAIVACNRAARRILALSDSPEGRPVAALGDALAALLAPDDSAEEHGDAQEMILDVKGRGEVPVRISAALVRGPLDAPGRLLLVEDLSERRTLESELRGTRRLASVGTLAAQMAHEIRNPLVSIKTFSQLLPERLDDQGFQLRFAQVAQREVDAIGRIIDRLLNFARQTELKRQPTNLEGLACEVIELLSPELQAQQIVVETDFAPDAPLVSVDHDKIRQVLRNVITNAAQAMPSGGRLRIATSTHGEQRGLVPTTYRMVITDTGCGIPEHKLADVFDPFFTTRERGFGLGLSLAQHIMEEHGGSIEIESVPGRSTTVTLTFVLTHAVEKSEHSAL